MPMGFSIPLLLIGNDDGSISFLSDRPVTYLPGDLVGVIEGI